MPGIGGGPLNLAHQRSPLPSGPVTFGDVDANGCKRSQDEMRIIREFLSADVNQFLADSKVDEAAIRALQTQTPEVQWEVIRKGAVSFSTNPSASLVGRIRDAKRGVPIGGPFGAPGGGTQSFGQPKPNLPLQIPVNPMQSGGLNTPMPGANEMMSQSAAPISQSSLQDAAMAAIAKLSAQAPG
jgi:hypothetical protein